MKRLRMIDLTMVVSMGLGGGGDHTYGGGFVYRIHIRGQLEQVIGSPPAPWEGIAVGSEFLVTYVFDTETPDLNNSNLRGIYEIVSLSVTLDGMTQVASSSFITVDVVNPFLQRYEVNFSDFSIGMTGGISLVGVFVFDSDSLPADIILNDWTVSQGFTMGNNDTFIGGAISTFSSRIVPTPGILYPFTLMGILFRRNRKRL